MKLYRHYKNKSYKYLGLARHSETQEEVVLYETRYDNPSGRLWVRPKNLFFQSIEVDGKSLPRFQEIPLQMAGTTEVTEKSVEAIAPLIKTVFGEWDARWFYSTFNNHKKFFLVTSSIENRLVGFKLGYELEANKFYSWLGGIDPEFRGLGIASDLMKYQHEWCVQQGYVKIQTKTQNRFRDMFILNLKHGFDVVGSHQSDEGGFKIIFEKNLK